MGEYIWGEDVYAAEQAIVKKAQDQRWRLRYLYKAELQAQGISGWLDRGTSLWEQELMVVVDPLGLPQEIQAAMEVVVESKRSERLIFWERGKPDARLRLHKVLIKMPYQVFRPLSADELERWVSSLAIANDITIESQAARWLVAAYKGNRWRIENEIKRLAVKEKSIDLAVVQQDNEAQVQADIFKVMDAVVGKSSKAAISGIEALLAQGEPELRIMALMSYQYKALWLVATGIAAGATQSQVAQATGLHPFVVEKNWMLAKRAAPEVWQEGMRRIAASNLAIKQGRIKERTALLMLVAMLAE